MIWNVAIYWTLVVRDALIVSLRCTLVYKPGQKRLRFVVQ
jgi:hypothetical protein